MRVGEDAGSEEEKGEEMSKLTVAFDRAIHAHYNRLIGERDRAVRALKKLVSLYRDGHPSFVSCITPPSRQDAKKGDKTWAAWDEAERAIKLPSKRKTGRK